MQRSITYRQALLLVAIIPIVAQVVGSAFNIFYNVAHVRPLISDAQQATLLSSIMWVNCLVYPAATIAWGSVVGRFQSILSQRERGLPIPSDKLESIQRLAINLPWWMILIGSLAWLSCIPMIVVPLKLADSGLDARVPILLTVSIVVSAQIALTHAFFALELASHKFLFPLLFVEIQPSSIRGAYPLTLRGRGIAWSLSAVFCPIVSILLLFYVPQPEAQRELTFPIAVGCIAMLFGLASAWLVGRLYGTPIRKLKQAAQAVARGELDTQVRLLRADEFGPLIEEFNQMTRGLQEKESLRRMFGLHVGRQAAEQILASVPGLGGVAREITVMFVDIRGFTASSEGRDPTEVVAVLNEFLTAMVDVVETQHHGMVNKYLGDGFMALFGVGADRPQHADDAVDAGVSMIDRLGKLNAAFESRQMPPLQIGIGIHSGNALVGSIGSNQRLEFTAIGDAVNIASRIESLTKTVGTPMLLTAATHRQLQHPHDLQPHAPQPVKGIRDPIVTYGLRDKIASPVTDS
ncbi:adenylate/guanylate cyclase domain-containing protein [Rosistilla carotiformis]|nr:adenylate/guanylate cyclase domain-containing protein [Rosistilla carotiformis]